MTIPFNRPALVGNEERYLAEAVRSGHLAGDGAFSKRCHAFFEQKLGVGKALLTTSCTDALEMAPILLGMEAGDEVIVPSFTFVSTANAFAMRGVRPVFCDVRPDTLNLDETKIEALIGPRTRAIVVVHYAGVSCEMDAIGEIARRHGLPIVEDNAHGLFGKYRGRWLGSIGALATQSFHETKNLTCGEGGALLINDASLVERAEILREKGTNRSRFFRGQVDKYTWVDIGSSYLLSDLQAAFLCAQLEQADTVQARRRAIWERYERELRDWAARHGVVLPTVPAHCEQAFHMFYLLMPELASRQAFIAHCKALGVMTVFHYLPLHLSPMGEKLGGRAGQCPVTEAVSDRLVRLPFFYELDEALAARVLEAALSFSP